MSPIVAAHRGATGVERVFRDVYGQAVEVLAAEERARFAGVGRNDLCPCGSGEKFKRCHGSVESLA